MTGRATYAVDLADEAATARLMADLALLIGPGDVIALSGDLGAGKTAAARAMIRYLADDDSLEHTARTGWHLREAHKSGRMARPCRSFGCCNAGAARRVVTGG